MKTIDTFKNELIIHRELKKEGFLVAQGKGYLEALENYENLILGEANARRELLISYHNWIDDNVDYFDNMPREKHVDKFLITNNFQHVQIAKKMKENINYNIL